MSFDIDYRPLPADMRAPLKDYVEHGRKTRRFLQAVLENDLLGAVTRADEDNAPNIRAWALFVYNELPGPCHGSPGEVAAWIAHRGEAGL